MSNLTTIGVLCVFLLFLLPSHIKNHEINEIKISSFDASITSNKDEYMIYEEIIATFNYSSLENAEFSYAISENISFSPIFQSEIVQGNFSKSEKYVFSLLDYNYSFSGQHKVVYLLLYHFDEIYGDDICGYKSIVIRKANLKCESLNNITYLKTNFEYSLAYNFSCLENSSLDLNDEKIRCTILYDTLERYDYTTSISSNGSIYLLVVPDNNSHQCEILLSSANSRIFNSASFSFQYNVKPQVNTSNNKVKILIISLASGIVISGIVYAGIKIYKRKLKHSYPLHKIKL